ncbi:MAG TPA: ATP-binding protein [Nitrososphaeraceae archaeon]|nr:ATP-binding protein [Nitrososphaeraceae archaeon]
MKILQLLILVCLGTAFLIGITSLLNVILINDIASELSENQTPKITTLYRMQILLKEATKDIFDFSRLEEAPQIQEFQANTNDFEINADELRRLASTTGDEEDKELMLLLDDDLAKQFSYFKDLGERLISIQVNQSDKIVQRRVMLNEQLDPIIDDRLQKDLSPSDLQYPQKQQALLEMEINMHELFSASSGYIVKPDSSLKPRINGSIADFQYWLERFLALNGYYDDSASNDNNSTGSIPVTTTATAADTHRSLLAGKIVGVGGATGTADNDNIPTAIITVISPQGQPMISTTIATAAASAAAAANPPLPASSPPLIQQIQNGDQTLQDVVVIIRGFDIVSKLTQDIIELEDTEQNQLAEFTRVETELHDLLNNKIEPIVLQEIQALENSSDDMVNMALASIVIAILLAVILGVVISSRIAKPIKRLRQAVSEVEAGNLDARVVGINDGGRKGGGGGGGDGNNASRSNKNSGSARGTFASEELTDLSHSFNSMTEKLKSNDRIQKEFLGIASHELRSPIQPILSYADLAIKGDLSYKQAIETIFAQALRLQNLANDILDVARIEAGQLGCVMRRVSVNRVIKDAANSIRQNLGKDVDLEVQLLEQDVEIELDADRIGQVLTNILGNAAKFTKKGKIKIETSRASENDGVIEIRISDTGGGIPEEILPRLFEKFATKDVGGSAKQGTGLGLYVSKAIINAHNGKISAFNNPEGGATFVISLPIEQER